MSTTPTQSTSSTAAGARIGGVAPEDAREGGAAPEGARRDSASAPPLASTRPARGVSPVWIVPLLALIVAAVLVLRDWLSHGPRYEVVVPSADGIEPTRTPVKCAGVVIGRVAEVTLAPDGRQPVAVIELEPWARRLLHADARFWIERPEISLQGIRGLGTIASGPFLVVEPGRNGSPPVRFEALARAPIAQADGLVVQLKSSRLRALRRGSPVLFRDMPVGQVIDLALANDAKSATVTIRIEPRFAPLIREGTKFWNASGFSLDLGITGLSTQVESLESVLVGGVSFATPDPPGEPPKPDAIFDLAEKPEARWLGWAPSIDLGK